MAGAERQSEEPSDLIGTLIGFIGKETTFAMVEALGGTRVYVPMIFSPRLRLAKVIGEKSAAILCAQLGGNYIAVPMAKPWRVRVYHERGLSYRAIASAIGSNEVTVFRHLKRMGLTRPAAAAGGCKNDPTGASAPHNEATR